MYCYFLAFLTPMCEALGITGFDSAPSWAAGRLWGRGGKEQRAEGVSEAGPGGEGGAIVLPLALGTQVPSC